MRVQLWEITSAIYCFRRPSIKAQETGASGEMTCQALFFSWSPYVLSCTHQWFIFMQQLGNIASFYSNVYYLKFNSTWFKVNLIFVRVKLHGLLKCINGDWILKSFAKSCSINYVYIFPIPCVARETNLLFGHWRKRRTKMHQVFPSKLLYQWRTKVKIKSLECLQ